MFKSSDNIASANSLRSTLPLPSASMVPNVSETFRMSTPPVAMACKKISINCFLRILSACIPERTCMASSIFLLMFSFLVRTWSTVACRASVIAPSAGRPLHHFLTKRKFGLYDGDNVIVRVVSRTIEGCLFHGNTNAA